MLRLENASVIQGLIAIKGLKANFLNLRMGMKKKKEKKNTIT